MVEIVMVVWVLRQLKEWQGCLTLRTSLTLQMVVADDTVVVAAAVGIGVVAAVVAD